MGFRSWTSTDWTNYATTNNINTNTKAHDIYKATRIKKEFDPKNIQYRESCDSDEHPNSTPIVIGLDVTGSMAHVLETVCKKLNVTVGEILERRPVLDPQICFMAFGDVKCDDYPLQVTQFESDIRIAEQLQDIYFEQGGGGNGGESYSLVWYFAARHTKIDSFDKHNKKGFIFTIGDECCHPSISNNAIENFIGDSVSENIDSETILTEANRKYEVYHLIVVPNTRQPVHESWKKYLGENAIFVDDINKIPEVIVSILELHAGKDLNTIANSWDGNTGLVVSKALSNLTVAQANNEVIEF